MYRICIGYVSDMNSISIEYISNTYRIGFSLRLFIVAHFTTNHFRHQSEMVCGEMGHYKQSQTETYSICIRYVFDTYRIHIRYISDTYPIHIRYVSDLLLLTEI